MDIKILTSMTKASVAYYYNERKYLVLGTHNGVFHSDEVVAIAILCLYYEEHSIRIVRSRDDEDLDSCDICVDIGGGEYDHHQPNFNLKRKNGIPFASAGLVWRTFGHKLISNYLEKFFPERVCLSSQIFNKFDEEVISLVDCEDNGIHTEKHCFSYIPSFLPLWTENRPDYDECFGEVLSITIEIFKKELFKTIQTVIAEKVLDESRKSINLFKDNILKIPSQSIPWPQPIVEINNSVTLEEDLINFVIFQYPAGGWAAQCVPPSLENGDKFKKRIPFPKEWAGLRDEELAKVSTVKDAIFCHNGCFFVRAKTKEDVLQMCKIAMEKANT